MGEMVKNSEFSCLYDNNIDSNTGISHLIK